MIDLKRSILAASLLASLLISLPPVSTCAARGKGVVLTEESVRAMEAARAKALLAADTTALARMTANDFIEISRLGQLRTRADNLRDIGSGELKLMTVKYDSMSVCLYDSVAVLRAIADNTGSFRGFPFAGRIWYTRIFVWREGRWQAVAMQHTPIP